MGNGGPQIKGNGGKLGLLEEKCVHTNCLMFQGEKYCPVTLPFCPFNPGAASCLPDDRRLGQAQHQQERPGRSLYRAVRDWWDLVGALLGGCCEIRAVSLSSELSNGLRACGEGGFSLWQPGWGQRDMASFPGGH